MARTGNRYTPGERFNNQRVPSNQYLIKCLSNVVATESNLLQILLTEKGMLPENAFFVK